ncbi:MAG: DMT family transporter [Deltaproteobacteria bacterium]|nr:DMT family transporter [Deltaproteobacteria bacterium]MBI2180628.1 DMT family transporter [Deltaproteobacteria bacterium]MBI2228225.1 DMT family transporter [Deltaproteobacteria bacterium]MBI2367054.1 DMT family transporter [Deltaproteobacteria bacterium]MBI2532802.1 DMT family transporter [Deltaproteobacteria bacterium]
MAIYFSFQAALCFSIAHILIRRGLVESNAMTGSFISLSMSAVLLWLLLPFFASLSALWTPVSLIFVVAGIIAPGIGRTLSYVGIEKIGVARSVPIANSSPIFASIFAVIFLAEAWVLQNIIGTLLVISGVIILSMTKPAQGEWRKLDVIYPLIGAIAFAASSILRKAGLGFLNIPLLAAAVTAASAAIFSFALLQVRGGKEAFKLTRKSAAWLFAAGFVNTAAMLSVFYALSHGKVVIVEPLVSSNPVLTLLLTAIFLRDLEALNLRVIMGSFLTVTGTILVVTVK